MSFRVSIIGSTAPVPEVLASPLPRSGSPFSSDWALQRAVAGTRRCRALQAIRKGRAGLAGNRVCIAACWLDTMELHAATPEVILPGECAV